MKQKKEMKGMINLEYEPTITNGKEMNGLINLDLIEAKTNKYGKKLFKYLKKKHKKNKQKTNRDKT